MGRNMGLLIDYLPLTERNSVAWDGVLGVVTFGDPPIGLDRTDIPVAAINTPMLGAGAAICEVWRTRRPAESGQRARVRYRCDDTMLFGCISVPETAASACLEDGNRSALQVGTENAYREIFSVLDSVGYGHLLRVWNYLPAACALGSESGSALRLASRTLGGSARIGILRNTDRGPCSHARAYCRNRPPQCFSSQELRAS